SRHPPEPGIGQQQLQSKQAESGQQWPLEQGAISGKTSKFNLRFFETINFIVDALELMPIRSAVKLAAREGGHFAKNGVVRGLEHHPRFDITVGIQLKLSGIRVKDRQLARLLNTDANGVHFDAQSGR